MIEKNKKNKVSIGITFLLLLIFPINVLAADCPRASYDAIPGMIQPGNNITLQAKSEGFSADEEDQERMNYVWCIDNVPLNTLNAGSADKITGNEVDGYYLQSDYGDIKGNFDKICDPTATLGVFNPQELFRYDDGEAICLRRDSRLYCNKENLDRIAARNLLSIDLIQKRIRIIQEGDNFWLPFTDIGNISYDNYVTNAPAPSEFYITRENTVDTDTDGDGLDDNWEIKYFKGRRISTVVETEDGSTEDISFYMPNEDEAVLPLVGPDRVVSPDNPDIFVEDPDGDAWEYPFKDEDNNYGSPWMIGAPYLKSSTSDVLVNPGLKSNDILREYIGGTNPLSSDTDDDGIKDGEDLVGKKQDNVHLVVGKEYGEKYNVMLRIFGVNDKYRNNREEGDKKYALFTYPAQEDSTCGFEATPEGENEFEVGLGLPLKVGWSYKPSPPIPGNEQITVIAETSKLTENAGLDLEFKWFLNSESRQDEDIEEEGYGKKIFQYNITTPTCGVDKIGLEIFEKNTNRLNFQEFEIPIGFISNLDMEVIANVDLENETVKQFNERKGPGIEGINFDNIDEQPFVLDNDAFRDRINEQEGFRTGDLVKATVNIEDGFGTECENKYKTEIEDENVKEECEKKYGIEMCNDPYELAVQNFNFKWNFKGKEQQALSGKGPDYGTAYFILRDGPRNIGEPTGEDSDSMSYGSNESATIEVLDNEKTTIARDKRDFEIKPPSIKFDYEGAEMGTSEEDDNQPTIYAGEDEITVHASLDYWRPSKGFTYRWLRNGEEVDEMPGAWDTIESSYTFRPGIDINGQSTGANKEIITLEVESEINYEESNNNLLTETATKTIEINLSSPEVDRENVGVAGALSKLIPRYYKNVFNLFFIFGLTGLATMLILGFMNKTSIKK